VRRHLILGAGLLAGAAVLPTTAAIGGGDSSANAVDARTDALRLGEEALGRGDAAEAQREFERAGSMQHVADSEMGLVRAYMQAGTYRRALAFAAHTAGAHPETPAGAVLYAWLLHVGGHTAVAQRVLDKTDTRAPGDELTRQARAQLSSPAPVATGALLSAPCRLAPFDAGAPLPATASVIATGTLVDGGRRALILLAAVGHGRALWVRDGLGRRSAASLERQADGLGLALLRLDTPIESTSRLVLAPRDPFAGSAAFAVQYAASIEAAPSWPLLRPGFFGPLHRPDGVATLDIPLSAGTPGGPVFDAAGRLAGIALRGPDSLDRLLTASALRREFGKLLGDVSPDAGVGRATVDVIYEAALRSTLQVISTP